VESENHFPIGIYGLCVFGFYVVHFVERWSAWFDPGGFSTQGRVSDSSPLRFWRFDSARFDAVSMAYPWCEYGVRFEKGIVEFTVSNFIESSVESDGVSEADLDVRRASQITATSLSVLSSSGVGENSQMSTAISKNLLVRSNYRSSFFEPTV
jgi:hypothetical protein